MPHPIPKKLLWLLPIALLLALVPPVPKLAEFVDLRVFYDAGQKAIAHHTVYDVPGHFQFKYMPMTAVLFGATLAPFAFERLAFGFYWLMEAAWIFFFLWVARSVWASAPPLERVSRGRFLWISSMLSLAFFGGALADELKSGQVNLFCALFLFLALRPGRTTLRGLGLALSIQFKIYALLALPWFIFRREWRVLASAVTWGLLINVILLCAFHGPSFGMHETGEWIRTLTQSSLGLLYWVDNVSLLGTLGRWTNQAPWHRAVWVAALVGYVGLLWKCRRDSWLTGFALILLAILILSPLAWSYWLLLGFPAVLLVVERTLRDGLVWPGSTRALLGFTALMLLVFGCLHRSEFARNHGICVSAGLLVCVLIWTQKRSAGLRSAFKEPI